ncbi:hypothetical protein [Gemmiger sp.]
MIDQAKLQEVFSDKEYVESIVKMSAEDAAKSLNEKGVEVTADDLMKLHDFVQAHKEELQNGELPEEALAGVAGGLAGEYWGLIGGGVGGVVAGVLISCAIVFSW